MAATHPILNYVEFRTNPEPYVVRGVVHGGMEKLILEIIRRRKKKRQGDILNFGLQNVECACLRESCGRP
jgi:hypothetical protein